jgi:muconate cycloisomerase
VTRAIVTSVETTILDIPLRRPHRFSVLTIDHQPVLLVRVRTADGVLGLGEGVVPGGPWWGGESVESMKVCIDDYLAPLTVGEDATRVEALRARMDRLVAANPFAKAALETALWDAWGRTAGLPLYELLGGLYRESIPVTWALGAASADEIVAEATAKLDAGEHTTFKLKMGADDPACDVARIAKIAASLAPRAGIRVDLNASWDELTATRYLPRLAEAGVELIEQPTPAWDVDALARLSALLDIPVMADESLRTEHDAFRLAAAHAADVFALKVPKSGGYTVTRRIAAVAHAAGIPCHGGTAIESALGTVATLHLCCATPGVTYGSELFGPLLMTDSPLTEPLDYRDGALHVPTGPGLGVELDDDAVRRLARG